MCTNLKVMLHIMSQKLAFRSYECNELKLMKYITLENGEEQGEFYSLAGAHLLVSKDFF